MGDSGTHNLLGVMHSRSETVWVFEAHRINVAMYPIPWKDDVLVHKKGTRILRLESVPNGLVVFELQP